MWFVPPIACLLLLVDPPPPLEWVQGVFCALSYIESCVRISSEYHQHNVHHYPVITTSIDRHRLVTINFVLLEIEFMLRGLNNVPRIFVGPLPQREHSRWSLPAVKLISPGHFSNSPFICNALLTLYGDTFAVVLYRSNWAEMDGSWIEPFKMKLRSFSSGILYILFFSSYS